MSTSSWFAAARGSVRPALLALLFPMPWVAEAVMVLVRDQQPAARIVLPADASPQTREAGRALQHYIQRSTGALLPIASETSTSGEVNLHVGNTGYVRAQRLVPADLDEEGFILHGVDERNYVVAGGSDWGTEFGVYEFLERHVGVRWLMPTELGEDVPGMATLQVPRGRVREEPTYLSRQLSPLDVPIGNVYLNVAGSRAIDGFFVGTDTPNRHNVAWARFNRARGRIAFHHNLENVLPPGEFVASHPEFYPVYNGKRFLPTGKEADSTDGPIPILTQEVRSRYLAQGLRWQPNFSAPGIVEAAVAVIDRYFQAHPNVKTFSLGMNDTSRFDESPASLARRSGRTNYVGFEDVSDDYFAWATPVVSKLVEKHPDAWFGTLAYHNLAEPPATATIHERLVPFLTYERMRWDDPKLRDFGEELTRRWASVSPALGWYDYTYGVPYMVPRLWSERMKDYLIWGTRHQVKFYYAELYPCWGEGPKAWLQTKLLWNPHQDVRALEDDWYRRAVGPAAGEKLREYFGLWEKFWTEDLYATEWNRAAGNRQWLPFTNRNYLLEIPAGYVDRSEILINEAVRLADTPQRKARMAKLKEFWQYYRFSIAAYQGVARGQQAKFETEAAVLAFLAEATPHLRAIGQRSLLLEELKADPLWVLMTHLFEMRWTTMQGGEWGREMLAGVEPWIERSPAVRAAVAAFNVHPDHAVRTALAWYRER